MLHKMVTGQCREIEDSIKTIRKHLSEKKISEEIMRPQLVLLTVMCMDKCRQFPLLVTELARENTLILLSL